MLSIEYTYYLLFFASKESLYWFSVIAALQSLSTRCLIQSGTSANHTADELTRRAWWLNSCATVFWQLFTCFNLKSSRFDIYSFASTIHGANLDRPLSSNIRLLIHVLLSDSMIIWPWHHCETSRNFSQHTANSASSTEKQSKSTRHAETRTWPWWFLTTAPVLACPVSSMKLASTFNFNQPCSGGDHTAIQVLV